MSEGGGGCGRAAEDRLHPETVHALRQPACATLCPFAANHKFENGSVVIDQDICFGGAKCQTLCPWQIPQRQSGIGVYLKVLRQ